MKQQWGPTIKKKVRELRKQAFTYGQLTKEFGIPKSTLHSWVHDIKRPTRLTQLDKLRWIKEIQPLAVQMNKRKRAEKLKQIISEAIRNTSTIDINRDMKKGLLAMLYWAEGSKVRGVLQFANIDPRVILLFVTLLRECYEVDESKFRVRLHLHYYHRSKEIKTFWSTLLNIPLTQFNKCYRKSRSKEKTFRRNFGGICFIKYNNVYLKEQLLEFAYSLTDRIIGKVNVPVVKWIEQGPAES